MKEHYEAIKKIGRYPVVPLCPSCLGDLEALKTEGFYGCPSCEVVMKCEAVVWGHQDRKYLEREWVRLD